MMGWMILTISLAKMGRLTEAVALLWSVDLISSEPC